MSQVRMLCRNKARKSKWLEKMKKRRKGNRQSDEDRKKKRQERKIKGKTDGEQER